MEQESELLLIEIEDLRREIEKLEKTVSEMEMNKDSRSMLISMIGEMRRKCLVADDRVKCVWHRTRRRHF